MIVMKPELGVMTLNLVVLMKQTFDTEEKVIITDGLLSEDGVKWIINPYDEYAIEEAVRWKENHGGVVTVVTAGPDRSEEALRIALAMGADEAVHLVLSPSDIGGMDEFTISHLLAKTLREKQPDLIFSGHFSVDQGSAQVAVRVASLLDLPHVAAITSIERINDSQVTVSRDAEGDSENLKVTLPALFTAQQGLNEPRYPTLPGIMKAKRKPIEKRSAAEQLQNESYAPATERVALELPPPRQAGQILKGTVSEQVEQLVQSLRDTSSLF